MGVQLSHSPSDQYRRRLPDSSSTYHLSKSLQILRQQTINNQQSTINIFQKSSIRRNGTSDQERDRDRSKCSPFIQLPSCPETKHQKLTSSAGERYHRRPHLQVRCRFGQIQCIRPESPRVDKHICRRHQGLQIRLQPSQSGRSSQGTRCRCLCPRGSWLRRRD